METLLPFVSKNYSPVWKLWRKGLNTIIILSSFINTRVPSSCLHVLQVRLTCCDQGKANRRQACFSWAFLVQLDYTRSVLSHPRGSLLLGNTQRARAHNTFYKNAVRFLSPEFDDEVSGNGGSDGCQNQEQEANSEEDSNENGDAGFGSADFASDDSDPPKQDFGKQIQLGNDEDQEAGWSDGEPAKSQGSQDPELKQEDEDPVAPQEQFEEAQEQFEEAQEQPETEQSQQQAISVKGESCINPKYFAHNRSRAGL